MNCRLRGDTRTETESRQWWLFRSETERDGSDDHRHPPRGQGTEEGGPPSTQGPGFCRSWRGSRGCQHALPHSTRLPCRGPLGSPGDSARTRLQCGIMLGKRGYYSHPRTAHLIVGGKVWALTPWPPARASARLVRSTHSHWGTQLLRGPPPWLTSLLTARYSKAWLIYPGHSWALLINSVPSNYSMENNSERTKKSVSS